MAGNSCSLTCNVKTADGKVKVSTLWKELMRFMRKDRKKALAYYFLTKDSDFLMENRNILEFDVDGEVTIEALKKVLDADGEYSDLSSNLVLEQLNQELGEKEYDYSVALEEVLRFNRSGKFKEDFMANLTRQENGKYRINVEKRSDEAEYRLADHVRNKIITEAIRTILKDRGLSVEFLDNPSYAVKYNTLNPEFNAMDGLYGVVSILNGMNTSAEIAEAAGHFIVDAMIDSPLVQRLMDQLTPEVQRELIRNESSPMYRPDFVISDTSAREAAGILIGHQLLAPLREAEGKSRIKSIGIKTLKSIKWLFSKIWDNVKKLFGMYNPNDIRKISDRALEMASTAAQGFIDSPSDTTMADIINKDSKKYEGVSIVKRLSDEARIEVKAYREMLSELKGLTANLKSITGRNSNPEYRDLQSMLKEFEKNLDSTYTPYLDNAMVARSAAVSGMTMLLEGMTQLLDTEVRRLLDEIQPSDRAQAYVSIASNGRNMRALNHIVIHIAQMYDIMRGKLDSIELENRGQFNDADGQIISEYLQDALGRLGEILVGKDEVYTDEKGREIPVHGLQELMELKRRQVFIDAYRDFYGDEYIEKSAGIVWERGKLTRKPDQRVAVKDFIQSLLESSDEISWFDRYLSSAADSGDFFVGAGRMVTGAANAKADRMAFEYFDKVSELELQMMELFGDTDWTRFLEVTKDEEGRTVRTGNFINKDNYGEWEKALKEKKKEIREEFYRTLSKHRSDQYEKNKNVKGYTYSLTDMERGVIYHTVADPMMKEFHKANSVRNAQGRWVPNPKVYHSIQWEELFDTSNPSLSKEEKDLRRRRLKWYSSVMEMKESIDSLLPKGATVLWRVPQLTGRSKHLYRNLKETYGGNRKAIGFWLRKKLNNLKDLKDDEAWKFGCDNDFNEVADDPLENEMFFERGKIDRLPIYGVNKLKDMNELSTDIFGSLLRYASMACTYNCMEEVADLFEIGKEVLKERKVGGTVEKYRHKESRAYSRYIRFVEKNVYQVNIDPIKWDRNGAWRKFMTGLSSLGGQILLWGNLHGGIVNTGTGFFEAWKEAVAGENFTQREFWEANKLYFNDILATAGNGLIDSQRSQNKNSLWIRHWNIRSENRDFLRGQKFDIKAMSLMDNRIVDWFGSTMMLPYSSGEHYMQTIPYYAMGLHTKVYDMEGHEMSLMDAYDIVDGKEVFAIEAEEGDDALGQTPKKLQLKDNIFRSVADILKYKEVEGMLGRIGEFLTNHPDLKDRDRIDPSSLFPEKSRKLLEEFGFSTPDNKKQLMTLANALELKKGSLKFNESDEFAFMEKCRNINNRLHGIYNQDDRVALQQNFYGSLVTAMRGYALGMINRRYADSRFNVPQRKVVEGSMDTWSKAALGMFRFAHAAEDLTSSYNFWAYAEATACLLPFANLLLFNNRYSNKLKADMQRAGFSAHQYYNIRRTGVDYLVIQTLWLAKLLSSPGAHFGLSHDEDEDDEKSYTDNNVAAGILYYFTNRWLAEQSAFSTIEGAFFESTSLMDYLPVGFSGAKAIWEIASLAAKTWVIDDPYKEDSELYYQSTKDGKYEIGDRKWVAKLKRLTPYYRSFYTFTHPYDSAAGWEYGRRIRNN